MAGKYDSRLNNLHKRLEFWGRCFSEGLLDGIGWKDGVDDGTPRGSGSSSNAASIAALRKIDELGIEDAIVIDDLLHQARVKSKLCIDVLRFNYTQQGTKTKKAAKLGIEYNRYRVLVDSGLVILDMVLGETEAGQCKNKDETNEGKTNAA